MLVVKNKSISLLSALETKLYFHVTSSRKHSTVLTPNMAKWSHGCKPRIPSKKEFIDKKNGKKVSFFHFLCHFCELVSILVAAIPYCEKLIREHYFLTTEDIEIS